MNGKKIMTIGLCLFMVTASLGVLLVKADDPNNTTVNASGAASSAGFWYPTFGCFTYQNGNADGTFVHFTIDETTGTISDYTVQLTYYPQVWYSPMDSKLPYENGINQGNITYQNKTIFSTIHINDFEQQAAPHTYADYLIYQGSNTFMKCTDTQGGNIHFAASNQPITITFEVPAGFNITQFTDMIYSTPRIDEQPGENGTITVPDQPTTPPQPTSSPWQTIWIKSDNTTTSINSYNGTFTIDGQTIELQLTPYGYLDVYTYVEYPAPPVVSDFWYNDLNITQDRTVIENAKDDGTIPAEGWYTKSDLQPPAAADQNQATNQITTGGVTSNYYTYDDPTFNMNFNRIDGNGVNVIVDSQMPAGRIVIINVDKEFLQTTSIEKLLVSFDDTTIPSADSLESLVQKVQNKDTTASYYAVAGEQLTTVFVYVPHFSTHTISIKSLTQGALSNILLPIILSAVFLCISIGGILIQKKKQKDEF
jgi:hypothetical protein